MCIINIMSEVFTCPNCGRQSPEVEDAGNGFCQDCAPEH